MFYGRPMKSCTFDRNTYSSFAVTFPMRSFGNALRIHTLVRSVSYTRTASPMLVTDNPSFSPLYCLRLATSVILCRHISFVFYTWGTTFLDNKAKAVGTRALAHTLSADHRCARARLFFENSRNKVVPDYDTDTKSRSWRYSHCYPSR